MNNVRLNRLNALLIPFILVSGMACSNDEAGTGADPENMVQNRIQEDLQDGLLAIPQLIIDTTNLPATKYLADQYLLKGIFQMNGIEKEVSFDIRFNGYAYPGEKNICGFDIEGKIDRNDFQVAGDDQLHGGKKIHGDIIHLNLSLRME